MKLMILSATPWGSVFIKENIPGIETKKLPGLAVHSGKLGGQWVALVEMNEEEDVPDFGGSLVDGIDPEYIVSLGEAYSCKKSLGIGDMVISSGGAFLETSKPNELGDARADQKLIDLGLKAVERFNNDDRLCKVVVGTVFLNPGTAKTGRKLNFLPQKDIYCIDHNGFPFTRWLVNNKTPFVMVRTIVPVSAKNRSVDVTQLKWDMAKRNFWFVKGILEGLKKIRTKETVGKVDLI